MIKSILIILAILISKNALLSDPDPTTDYYSSYPDVVMIDTGSTRSYAGFIRMKKTCESKCWNQHGEKMAKALENQVSVSDLRGEVNVDHLVWEDPNGIAALIDRAAAKNPKVIVMALAGDQPVSEEYYAIERATRAGIMVVAASGNQGKGFSQYPANYPLPCLISVSTSNWYGGKVRTANSGEIYLEQVRDERGTSFSTARSAAVVLKYYETYGKVGCGTIKRHMVRDLGSAQ